MAETQALDWNCSKCGLIFYAPRPVRKHCSHCGQAEKGAIYPECPDCGLIEYVGHGKERVFCNGI